LGLFVIGCKHLRRRGAPFSLARNTKGHKMADSLNLLRSAAEGCPDRPFPG
jgi:hypothetical protein